jgi:putative cardiolipin synthase
MPLDHPKTPSTALTDTADTHLARESATWRDGQLQGNGFYSLSKGQDAFGARLVLMSGAEQSIDAQYFLMKPDNAGLVFTEKLMEAADRGVRVRLLLDDVFTTVDDGYFSFMDAHPNVEVRIFNPVSRKGLYALNYLGHFSLANRRMHNKSFIVDNQAAIVGGRNIAAEYFQLETTGEFIDFDMFATGPIVKDISDSFDTYWNNELAVPIEAISGKPDQELLERDDKAVRQLMKKAGNSIYADAINSPLMRQFSADEIDPYMAKARVIVDDPSKLRAEISEEHQILATEIAEVLNQAKQEIIIFTPYFIPGKSGIEFVRRLRDKGVRIIVITNSLASNNHTAVHSAYARYRKDLLKAGVELWEARANASVITVESDDTTLTAPLTLHTKGILVDRRQVFVGSLNLDPRSIDINTEMGLLIESEPLVSEMTDRVMVHIPRIAYRLQLDDSGKINWHANIDGHEVVETKEPLTSGWKRFTAWLLKIAPEQQL